MKNLRKKVVVAISVIAFVGASVFGVVNTVNADPPGGATATKHINVAEGKWCEDAGVNCIATVVVVGSHN